MHTMRKNGCFARRLAGALRTAMLLALPLALLACNNASNSGTVTRPAPTYTDSVTLNATSYPSCPFSAAVPCSPATIGGFTTALQSVNYQSYSAVELADTTDNSNYIPWFVVTFNIGTAAPTAFATYPVLTNFTGTANVFYDPAHRTALSGDCHADTGSVTVNAYGALGGIISGTFMANMINTATPTCPPTLNGSFAVTRSY